MHWDSTQCHAIFRERNINLRDPQNCFEVKRGWPKTDKTIVFDTSFLEETDMILLYLNILFMFLKAEFVSFSSG